MSAIRLRPTARFGSFVLLLVVLWLVSANYRNNLGYLLTYLLAGVALAAPFQTCRQIAGVCFKVQMPKPVFAGAMAQLPLWLENDGGPKWQLRIKLQGGIEPVFTLNAGEKRLVELSYPTKTRGLVHIGPAVLSSSFPLGLFEAARQLDAPWTLWVYPAPAAQAPPPKGIGQAGQEGETAFQGIRSYRPGDAPGRIYWKGLAKRQGLLTKEFAQEPADNPILSDWETLPPGDTEQRLAWLCRWLVDAENHGEVYGLRLPDRSLLPSQGPGHLHACLRLLAQFPGGARA